MAVENTHYGAAEVERLVADCRKVFFIGIGGVSMSSLAQITKSRGYSVAGSDRESSQLTEKLGKQGITVHYGHSAENVRDCDAVVYTIAISPENPEYVEAERLGIPRISRADYLGWIMTGYERRTGIAGMHGKSTCTSMCAAIYMAAKRNPTVLSGACYPAMGGFYRIGDGGDFIFEACEYRDSFLDFNPTTAVILNIELEHVDYFGSIECIRESFSAFAGLPRVERVVINADDENCRRVAQKCRAEVVTFGIEQGDYKAGNIEFIKGCASFDIICKNKKICRVTLAVPGRHNIYDALAAAVCGIGDGIDARDIAAGLAAFTGASRRMEYRGRLNGAAVYDDYGHHPTEIAATLKAARSLGNGKLVCAFQPHTYTRTAVLFDDFVKALSFADRVLLAPIYAARETDNLGVSSEKLAAAIGNADAFPTVEAVAAALLNEVGENDTLVVMGAGDIDRLCGMLEYDK